METALAQRVLQCVARVHEVGWAHCDIKPTHFMRFASGELKMVDFGSAAKCGSMIPIGHSRRYCPPELAVVVKRDGPHAEFRVTHDSQPLTPFLPPLTWQGDRERVLPKVSP